MNNVDNVIKKNSMRYQLLSRFFAILILLLFSMEIFQYINMQQYLYKSKEQLLASRFRNVDLKNIIEIQTPQALNDNAQILMEKTIDLNMSVAIIDSNGYIIATNNQPVDDIDPKTKDDIASQDNIPIPKLTQMDYEKEISSEGNLVGNYKLVKDENNNLQVVTWRKIGNLNSPTGLMQFSITASDVQNILNKQLYFYILASIFVLVIGAILGLRVFDNTLKPFHKMTKTVEQINIEQLHIRLLSDTGQIEVDKLSNAFNKMLERIEISFEQEHSIKERMRQFVSNASHELRTPLTSIHGFVEVLLRGAAKNEEQLNLALNTILNESDRLTKLVNELLLLTNLDQQLDIEMNTENISNIVMDIYPQLQMLCGKRKIELLLKDNAMVRVNNSQIKQVIINLVQNSIQHTDEYNGIIVISTDYSKKLLTNYVVLTIADNGTGIPKENLDRIFDRFFRCEPHRSRKLGGYGLGLSIVKSIIDAHDGQIEVLSELGTRTSFSIYLKSPQDI